MSGTKLHLDLTCFNWQMIILKTKLPYIAKYLALYLSTYMNPRQDIAWPSLKTIIGETGLSRGCVCNHLNILENERYLVRVRGNSKASTMYAIALPERYEEVVHQVNSLPKWGSTPDGQGSTPDGLGVVHQMDPNNKGNNKLITKDICSSEMNDLVLEEKEKKNGDKYSGKGMDKFNDFWLCYPRKADKAKAAKIWKSRKYDRIADKIIDDVLDRKYKTEVWLDVKEEFILMPSTYLRNERFNDEEATS